MRARTAAFAVLMLPAVLSVGCKKQEPPAPPPAPPPVVEVKLQVTSVSPSTVEPDTPTSAKVFGSGFRSGVTVAFSNEAGSWDAQQINVSDANTVSIQVPGLRIGSYDVRVANPDGERANLRGGLTVKRSMNCELAKVNFDFDVSNIRSDARSVIETNMSCWQQGSGQITVEGHCDERGTVDYNIALGQRRADSVKRAMSTGGVTTKRIKTVSYGEERPAARGHNESVWSQNRRAEIKAPQ